MSTDLPIQAYKLLACKRSDDAPNGLLEVSWIAVARGARKAELAVRTQVGEGWDIVLLGGGEAVMQEARMLGIGVGDARQLI